ncbi:uncharacterized protein LOC128884335 isoform X2 [Hylaeus volcanicus]|nr:uncharacterized protein LOC128884335 isoform X2 [Hylaeus volcanicus]
MKYLKNTLDAKGHCVLEMPTGTGKTVALLSLITSYQLANPEIGKLTYCTRTVPEMEKTLNELKVIMRYQHEELRKGQLEKINNELNNQEGLQQDVYKEKIARHQKFLGMGMASRRNLCIHPDIIKEAFRDKVDERCQALTASWVRAKRSAVEKMASFALNSSTDKLTDTNSVNKRVVHSDAKMLLYAEGENNLNSFDIEDGGCNASCRKKEIRANEMGTTTAASSAKHSCPYYENFDAIWSPDLLEPGSYTIEEFKKLGESWRHPQSNKFTPVCPYFSSRRAIQKANVVVLSYQYILDPRVSQVALLGSTGVSQQDIGSTLDPLPKKSNIVVFDEAHNIDNVCIDAFSVNLNLMILERSRQNIEYLKKEIDRMKSINASRLMEEYDKLVQNLQQKGHLEDIDLEGLGPLVLPSETINEAIPGTIRRAEFFVMILEKLLYFLSVYIRVFTVKTEGVLTFLKNLKDETTIDPKILKFCSERLRSLLNTLEVLTFDEFSPLSLVCDFFTLIGTYWEGFILITDPYPEAEGIYDPVVQLGCLDSSLAMKRIFKHFQSIILTSGTISPLFLYPKLLGFNPVIVKSLPMSLDRNCICPLIVVKGADQVPMSSKFILRSDDAVLRNYGTLLKELSKSVPDGIVCFFPSYTFMEHIVAAWYRMSLLSEVMQYKLILMETRDVVATTLALQSYRKACDSGRGAVFFCVARGKVAEGIDFDRHYGRAVVLFGIPYQYTLSRLLKARLDYLRENYQISESEFLDFDAMRQAAQCVGRIIRSKSDYGLMVFADSRYARLDKREKLPEWILRHLDTSYLALSTDTALSVARRFLLEMSQPFQMTSKSRFDPSSKQIRSNVLNSYNEVSGQFNTKPL